jgi:pimeloyl-ACP methyl ester carboxylesterase
MSSFPSWIHTECENGGFHIFFNELSGTGDQINEYPPGYPLSNTEPVRPGIDGDIEALNAEACWDALAYHPANANATLTVTGLGSSLKAPNLGLPSFCLDYNNDVCDKKVGWTFISFEFPMDGFAPQGTMSHSITLTWDGQSGTRSFTVLPRPVVLVHGLKSNPHSWASWYEPGGYLCTHGYPPDSAYTLPEQDWQLSYPGEHPTWDPDWCGFPVDAMDTASATSKSIDQNAQALADYLQVLFDTMNYPKVDLVGHSMGGLISRWYISNLMPHDLIYHTPGGGEIRWQPVTRLAMLGTPNMGSYAAVEGSIIRKLSFGLLNTFIPQPATTENSPDFVRNVVNTMAVDRHNVHFFAIGGDLGAPGLAGGCISLDGYPSDLVVNRNSTRWVLTDSEYADMRTTHIGKPLTCRTASDGAEQQSPSDFARVLQFLQTPEYATPIGGDTSDGLQPRTGAAPVPNVPAQQTGSGVTAARGVLLAPGQSVTITTASPPNAPALNALVGIDPTLPHPQIILRAPNGLVYTPQRPFPGFTSEDLSGAGGDVPPILALSVALPRTGIWRLTVTNPAGSKTALMPAVPMFTTLAAGGLQVAASTDGATYAPGATVTLTAHVTGVAAATVTAEVDSANNASFTPIHLTLSTDAQQGPGVYTASFQAPMTPGTYEASVTAVSGTVQSFDVAEFAVSS